MNFKVPWLRKNTFFTTDSWFGFCYMEKRLVFVCFFYIYIFSKHRITPKFVSTLSHMVSIDCLTSSSSVLVI